MEAFTCKGNMGDHDLAKELRLRGWDGKTHVVGDATLFLVEDEVVPVAIVSYNNATCTKKVWLRNVFISPQ